MFRKRAATLQNSAEIIDMPMKGNISRDDVMERVITLYKDGLSDCMTIGNCAQLSESRRNRYKA